MTDPVTAAAAAGLTKAVIPGTQAAKLGTSLFKDMLEPPAKAMGRHLEARVDRWSESEQAKHVAKLAAAKSVAHASDSIPPRVFGAVMDAAEYSDDVFVAEYLSGVLASSMTPGGTDDRGVIWSALIGRLSSDALKLHYVIYSVVRQNMLGMDVDLVASWCRRHIVIPYTSLLPALRFDSEEAIPRALDAAYALQREGLIGSLTHGGHEFLTGQPYGGYVLPTVGDMLILTPTIQGIQLGLLKV